MVALKTLLTCIWHVLRTMVAMFMSLEISDRDYSVATNDPSHH